MGPFARNFGVYVDASGAKSCVVRLDVLRRECAVSAVASDRVALTGRNKRDRVRRTRRRHFDPTMDLPVGEIDTFLEPEFVEVELKCSVLIGHRDENGRDLGDASRVCGGRHIILKTAMVLCGVDQMPLKSEECVLSGRSSVRYRTPHPSWRAFRCDGRAGIARRRSAHGSGRSQAAGTPPLWCCEADVDYRPVRVARSPFPTSWFRRVECRLTEQL